MQRRNFIQFSTLAGIGLSLPLSSLLSRCTKADAHSQRLLYWPMLKSGDFDAILPQFELYRKGLPGATARVKKHFGHEGAVYCEYTSDPGLAFGDGWGWHNDNNYRICGEEIPFGDPRANAATAFNDPVEKGVMTNGSIAYH